MAEWNALHIQLTEASGTNNGTDSWRVTPRFKKKMSSKPNLSQMQMSFSSRWDNSDLHLGNLSSNQILPTPYHLALAEPYRSPSLTASHPAWLTVLLAQPPLDLLLFSLYFKAGPIPGYLSPENLEGQVDQAKSPLSNGPWAPATAHHAVLPAPTPSQ